MQSSPFTNLRAVSCPGALDASTSPLSVLPSMTGVNSAHATDITTATTARTTSGRDRKKDCSAKRRSGESCAGGGAVVGDGGGDDAARAGDARQTGVRVGAACARGRRRRNNEGRRERKELLWQGRKALGDGEGTKAHCMVSDGKETLLQGSGMSPLATATPTRRISATIQQ